MTPVDAMTSRPGAHLVGDQPNPYRIFSRDEWSHLRADTPLTLTVDDLVRLQSVNDPISVEEVVAIYLPLSRLLSLYVAATQGLFKATQRFLGAEDGKMPYVIGIAGSVAVGKSTTARVLKRSSRAGQTRRRSSWSPPTASFCPTPSCSGWA